MYADIFCLIVNHVTMIPLVFPLPAPYFFNKPYRDIVNILNGMDSPNINIKLFAFYDFSMKSQSTSESFFSLSSPGNQPHLWKATLAKCLRVINNVRLIILEEAEDLSRHRDGKSADYMFLNCVLGTPKESISMFALNR